MAIDWLLVQKRNSGDGDWNLHDPNIVNSGSHKIIPAYVTNTSSITNTVSLVYCDMVLDDQIVTMPDATVNENNLINIKNRGAKSFTIEGAGSDTVDGDLNATIYEKECFTLHADDNANWNII